jgi:hypothetical protein
LALASGGLKTVGACSASTRMRARRRYCKDRLFFLIACCGRSRPRMIDFRCGPPLADTSARCAGARWSARRRFCTGAFGSGVRWTLGGDTAPERIHKIDHVLMGRLDGRPERGTRPLLFTENAHKGVAIMILQHGWIEFSRLRPDNVLRKLHHLGGSLTLGTSLKYSSEAPHLV